MNVHTFQVDHFTHRRQLGYPRKVLQKQTLKAAKSANDLDIVQAADHPEFQKLHVWKTYEAGKLSRSSKFDSQPLKFLQRFENGEVLDCARSQRQPFQ